MEATGSPDNSVHFYHTWHYTLQIATFTVISMWFEHRNSWRGRSANHAHAYQRVYVTAAMHMAALSHKKRESEGISHDSCSTQDCYTRNKLCDVHFYYTYLTLMTTTLCTLWVGDVNHTRKRNISSATHSTQAVIPLWGISHFNINSSYILQWHGQCNSSSSSSSSVWGRQLPTECTAAFRDLLY
jgi:hypothetical protein